MSRSTSYIENNSYKRRCSKSTTDRTNMILSNCGISDSDQTSVPLLLSDKEYILSTTELSLDESITSPSLPISDLEEHVDILLIPPLTSALPSIEFDNIDHSPEANFDDITLPLDISGNIEMENKQNSQKLLHVKKKRKADDFFYDIYVNNNKEMVLHLKTRGEKRLGSIRKSSKPSKTESGGTSVKNLLRVLDDTLVYKFLFRIERATLYLQKYLSTLGYVGHSEATNTKNVNALENVIVAIMALPSKMPEDWLTTNLRFNMTGDDGDAVLVIENLVVRSEGTEVQPCLKLKIKNHERERKDSRVPKISNVCRRNLGDGGEDQILHDGLEKSVTDDKKEFNKYDSFLDRSETKIDLHLRTDSPRESNAKNHHNYCPSVSDKQHTTGCHERSNEEVPQSQNNFPDTSNYEVAYKIDVSIDVQFAAINDHKPIGNAMTLLNLYFQKDDFKKTSWQQKQEYSVVDVDKTMFLKEQISKPDLIRETKSNQIIKTLISNAQHEAQTNILCDKVILLSDEHSTSMSDPILKKKQRLEETIGINDAFYLNNIDQRLEHQFRSDSDALSFESLVLDFSDTNSKVDGFTVSIRRRLPRSPKSGSSGRRTRSTSKRHSKSFDSNSNVSTERTTEQFPILCLLSNNDGVSTVSDDEKQNMNDDNKPSSSQDTVPTIFKPDRHKAKKRKSQSNSAETMRYRTKVSGVRCLMKSLRTIIKKRHSLPDM